MLGSITTRAVRCSGSFARFKSLVETQSASCGKPVPVSFLPVASYFSTSSLSPWVRAVGETGLLLRFGTTIDTEVSEAVLSCLAALDTSERKPAGVKDILPAYASLLIHYDPLIVSQSDVEAWCLLVAKEVRPSAEEGKQAERLPAVVHEIPVRYGPGEHGPDIEAAAEMSGLGSAEAVARAHSDAKYRVYFLGFTGGFPYLGGLADALKAVPRLPSPRQSVPKGAVGIAAGQTGVYTLAGSPGGWHLLGRTQVELFDPARDPPALLRAGDQIKFVPADDLGEDPEREEESSCQGKSTTVVPQPKNPCLEIIAAGPLTTIQDIGRIGYARHGVSRSGAVDALSLRMGNVLVGNDSGDESSFFNPGAAALEVNMGGLKMRCISRDPCPIAVTGADCVAFITRAPMGNAQHQQQNSYAAGVSVAAQTQRLGVNEVAVLHDGDTLELGFATGVSAGCRTYVSVRGGFDVPSVLGSRSTDLRARMGGFYGRALQDGDCLGRCVIDINEKADCESKASASEWPRLRSVYDPLRQVDEAESTRTWTLRILIGPGDPSSLAASPDSETESALQALVDQEFTVLPRSDRMAVCITPKTTTTTSDDSSPALSLIGGQQMSEACVSGTVQVPPDGNPVILLAEHQTTGGYKVPAVVAQADLWRVGQMRPGDWVKFEFTTVKEATQLLRRQQNLVLQTESLKDDGASAGDRLNLMALAAAPNQMVSHVDWGNSISGMAEPDGYGAVEVIAEEEEEEEEEEKTRLPRLDRPPSFSLHSSRPHLVPRLSTGEQWIDLNADCGEGYDDAGLLEYVTSVNIACGGHVGNAEDIARTVALADEKGAAIGAHVSFVDREGFGRRPLDTPPNELRDQVLWQAGALQGLTSKTSSTVSYMKPHGALYHTVMAGGDQANAVIEAACLLGLPLLLMPSSRWASFGEGFAERAYDGKHVLRPRTKEGALIHDPTEAARQAVALANENADLHSICVHGDSPSAVVIARAVRSALEQSGYRIRSFAFGR